ncbi:plasmid pRiA4b ORF-3 family protein [Subtercola vilae]|uniref:Plasmid pRiA4b ORF-3 family protein n=1 Tax=Subtercola vilae TaxID=2056433 RepID=A0A4T2BRU4_9MICO|nr:plasmid pRiA4b ORF-3 family protein [Subtercola vilae]TIH33900.1 plasmid pRiA4b ORF-3 family protein [Subtercola vilae]
MLCVRVGLVGSRVEVWRLVEIDASLLLDRVHAVLQVVMGWEDTHLHAFADADPDTGVRSGLSGLSGPRRWGPGFLREDDEDLLLEENITLGVVLSVDRPLFYEYDFGDQWLHRLDVIEIRSAGPAERRVVVVRGAGRCPLEDRGGVDGYEQLLMVLADPAHEEHGEYAEWVAAMTGQPASQFNPALFNPDVANRLLRERFPASGPAAQ